MSALARRVPDGVKSALAEAAIRNRLAYHAKVAYLGRRTDAFLISFPKCGRTWLRLLLGKAVATHARLPEGNLMRFTTASVRRPGIPRILATHDDSPQVKRPEDLMTSKAAYRRHPVVFLVRDPRDVVVSLYFHRTRRKGQEYPGTLSDFLDEPEGSLDSLLRFYDIWDRQQHVPAGFLLVRYEDMHVDPHRELRRVLDFVGLAEVSEATIDDAVHFAAFERVRQAEARGALKTRAFTAVDASDPESFKARKGKVGGYAEYLTPEEVARLDERIGRHLGGRFGYGAGA